MIATDGVAVLLMRFRWWNGEMENWWPATSCRSPYEILHSSFTQTGSWLCCRSPYEILIPENIVSVSAELIRKLPFSLWDSGGVTTITRVLRRKISCRSPYEILRSHHLRTRPLMSEDMSCRSPYEIPRDAKILQTKSILRLGCRSPYEILRLQ